MRHITICTQNHCPYCIQLKMLFKRWGIPYQELNLSERPDDLKALRDETSFYTLPQVFADDDFLGGYDNILSLYQAGKLFKLLGLDDAH